MRSAAARAEVADFDRARYGSMALRARCCSIVMTMFQLEVVLSDLRSYGT